jgi:Ni,Fe-hydrogenase I large subunit
MKKLLLVIIYVLCLVSNVKSQDTCFTKKQIVNIYNNIRVLEYNDSIQKQLISQYKFQEHDYRNLRTMDSTTIAGQVIQVENLQQNCKDLKEICKQVTPAWYERPLFVIILTSISTVFVLRAL